MEMEKPVWLKLDETELKKIIAELAEKHQPAELGLILRDQYGIPTMRVYGKKLSYYLKELNFPESLELKNAEKKFEKLILHLKKNKTDKKAKHKLQKIQGNLNTLRKNQKKKSKRTE